MINRAILATFAFVGIASCGGAPPAPGSVGEEQLAAQTGQFCGGIAGIPCPAGETCVDDPTDNCDPNAGGADCSGICVKTKACKDNDPNKHYVGHSANECAVIRFVCPVGESYFSDKCGCGCKGHEKCDYNDPNKTYVGTSAAECATIKFLCIVGTTYFSDNCGCGCETL